MGIQYNVPLEKFLISHPFYIFDGLYRNPVTKDIYCIIKPNVATPTTKEEKIIVEMKEGEGVGALPFPFCNYGETSSSRGSVPGSARRPARSAEWDRESGTRGSPARQPRVRCGRGR